MSLINTMLRELSDRDPYRSAREKNEALVLSGLVPSATTISGFGEAFKLNLRSHQRLYAVALIVISSVWLLADGYKKNYFSNRFSAAHQEKTLRFQFVPFWNKPWGAGEWRYAKQWVSPFNQSFETPWALDAATHSLETFRYRLNVDEVVERIENFKKKYTLLEQTPEKNKPHAADLNWPSFEQLPPLPLSPDFFSKTVNTSVSEKVSDPNLGFKKTRVLNVKPQHLTLAQEAFERGDYVGAKTHFLAVSQQKSSDVQAKVGLIESHLALGEIPLAERKIEKALKKDPQNPDFWRLKGRLLFKKGETNEALMYLKGHQPVLERYPDYYALMAAVYQKVGAYELASSYYREVLSVDPSRGVWWLGLAVALDSEGKNSDAISSYEKAHQLGLSQVGATYVQDRLEQLVKMG